MIQKVKRSILIVATLLAVVAPAALPAAAVYADCTNIAKQAAIGASQAATNDNNSIDCTSSTNVDASGIGSLANKIVNIFSIVVGAIAVIMIIYGGFRYITSGGDSGSVGNAKNTLIYAIVGLVIVALAQLIVHFVLNTASTGIGTS